MIGTNISTPRGRGRHHSICVCNTNHALDQLLEDILESGITSNIVRIGSSLPLSHPQEQNEQACTECIDLL